MAIPTPGWSPWFGEKNGLVLQPVGHGTASSTTAPHDGERAIKKGHTYRIVISDLERGRPIWVDGTGRTEADLDRFFLALGPQKTARIRLPVIDRWKPSQLGADPCAAGPDAVRDVPHPASSGRCHGSGRARLALDQDHFLLAYFGYVDSTKGVETLLQAVQLVTKQAGNVRLVMIGGGRGTAKTALGQRGEFVASYAREMQSLSERLGIADRVTWLPGYSSGSQEASMYLYAADACVLPFDQGVILSRSSLAAAAAHGLPIITTRGEHLESPFQDRENVFLCRPKDPEELALAISSIMKNPNLIQDLRNGTWQLAEDWFSWDKAVARTIGAFQKECRCVKDM